MALPSPILQRLSRPRYTALRRAAGRSSRLARALGTPPETTGKRLQNLQEILDRSYVDLISISSRARLRGVWLLHRWTPPYPGAEERRWRRMGTATASVIVAQERKRNDRCQP